MEFLRSLQKHTEKIKKKKKELQNVGQPRTVKIMLIFLFWGPGRCHCWPQMLNMATGTTVQTAPDMYLEAAYSHPEKISTIPASLSH